MDVTQPDLSPAPAITMPETDGAEECSATDGTPVAEEMPAGEETATETGANWNEIVRRDRRVGYLLVDMLAGEEVDASVRKHFGGGAPPAAVEPGLLEEAERRGYLKARNEMAEAKMKQPGLWKQPEAASGDRGGETDPELDFLSYIRPSVWD